MPEHRLTELQAVTGDEWRGRKIERHEIVKESTFNSHQRDTWFAREFGDVGTRT